MQKGGDVAEGSEKDASARRTWRLWVVVAGAALLLLAVALATGLSGRAGDVVQGLAGQPPRESTTGAVPPATEGFVTAYGHSDYATIERVASPLYFVEWARQGVSLGEQASLLEQHQRSATGEWLYLTYATGVVDSRDFGHYLYVGRPISGSGAPSVWRVDTDSTGQVIWIELVWLFSSRSVVAEVLTPTGGQDDSALRSLLPAGTGDRVFGVRSADSLEGYYGVVPLPVPQPTASGPDNVQFYAVDESGAFRLPVWSYGERFPNHPLAGKQPLQPEQARVLSAYLASIH